MKKRQSEFLFLILKQKNSVLNEKLIINVKEKKIIITSTMILYVQLYFYSRKEL
jgi:hypothetical protein